MKKKLFIVLAVVLIAAVLVVGSYFIIKSQLPDNSNGVAFTLVLRDASGNDTKYDLSTEQSTLFDALLEQKEKGTFILEYSGSGESAYLNKIGNLDSSSYEQGWLALYTSIDDSSYSNASWGTAIYNSQTLSSCALGMNSMPINEGVIYLIELKETW